MATVEHDTKSIELPGYLGNKVSVVVLPYVKSDSQSNSDRDRGWAKTKRYGNTALTISKKHGC